MEHCDTCTCKPEVEKPMHRNHTYRDEPSYFSTDSQKREAVYLCEKTITGEQRCWVTKRERQEKVFKPSGLNLVTDSQKITRNY